MELSVDMPAVPPESDDTVNRSQEPTTTVDTVGDTTPKLSGDKGRELGTVPVEKPDSSSEPPSRRTSVRLLTGSTEGVEMLESESDERLFVQESKNELAKNKLTEIMANITCLEYKNLSKGCTGQTRLPDVVRLLRELSSNDAFKLVLEENLFGRFQESCTHFGNSGQHWRTFALLKWIPKKRSRSNRTDNKYEREYYTKWLSQLKEILELAKKKLV